jgi:hypothetical protein
MDRDCTILNTSKLRIVNPLDTSMLRRQFSVAQWFEDLEEPLANHLLSHFPIGDLTKLISTSKQLLRIIRRYQRYTWDFPAFLKAWFMFPHSFLAKMELTGTVATGWQPLRFLDRLPPLPERGIELGVRIAGVLPIGRHLLAEGYSLDAAPDPALSDQHLVAMVMDTILKHIIPLEEEHTSILSLSFTKRAGSPLAGGTREDVLKVNIVVTDTDPIDFIMDKTTCSMCLLIFKINYAKLNSKRLF